MQYSVSAKTALGVGSHARSSLVYYILSILCACNPRKFVLDLFVSYGRPGVELSARHQEETVIQELHFLPEQVSDWVGRRLFVVCLLNVRLQIDRGEN